MKTNVTVAAFTDKSFFSCNVLVITSPKGTLVVDPGYYKDDVKDYIDQIGRVDAILISHGHWDHINGLQALHDSYPDAPIYLYEGQKDFLTSTHLNCSEVHPFDCVVHADAIELKEGIYQIAGYEVEVIHTPGHTAKSCMFYFLEDDFLITADTVLAKMFGTTIRPTGSEDDLMYSAEKLLQRGFRDDLPCYCGHGENTTFSQIKRVLKKEV